MILPRRDFLRLLGVTAGTEGLGGCGHRWAVPEEWVDLALRGPGLESRVETVCGLCEGGCGLSVRLVDGVPVGLKGNPHHPLNQGGLCPVGQAGLEILYAPERLQGPKRRGPDGGFAATTWDQALEEIGTRLSELSGTGEGWRVALLDGEHGTLFHDLSRRFTDLLGSPNLARTGRGLTLPFELSQGLSETPGYDLAGADLVLSAGLDLYEGGAAPMHAIAATVGSRRNEERAGLIHVGTRLSPSAAKASPYVMVKPGTHGAFALGVAHVLVREGSYDRDFVAEHTFGFEDWDDEQGRRRLGFRRLLIDLYYPDRAAQLCGCDPSQIVEVARRMAKASRPLALAGGEAVEGANAVWTATAVHALNALLGAFDRPGGVVMPAEIPFTPLDRLGSGTNAERPSIFAFRQGDPGLAIDPIEALTERVLDGSHPLEVLILVNANPVFARPLGDRLRQALERIPMVVALTSFVDESAIEADFVLPTSVPLERWQDSTTPSGVAFSVLGIGKPVVEPLFDTRHPGDILLGLVARASNGKAPGMPWSAYSDYLKHRLEGLAISGQGSVVTGTFEDSWVQFLEERGWRFLEDKGPEDLWNDLQKEAGWWNPVRPRGNWPRLFKTPSGRFEFFSLALEARLQQVGAGGDNAATGPEALQRGIEMLDLEAVGDEACLPHFERPKVLGTGELILVPFRPITARGEIGVNSPMLAEMFGYPVYSGWETWVELASETAHELGIEYGDRVEVESDRSSIEAVVRVQPGATPGVLHIPVGLGHRVPAGGAKAFGSNPIELVMPDRDLIAGTVATTSTQVRVRLVERRKHGGPPPDQGGHGA